VVVAKPSAPVVKLGRVSMAVAPWVVSDELWELVAPVLPTVERRVRFPGRRRLPDRRALQGILFVLHTGIAWRHLPLELGFGSGSTCYRRLEEWRRAGVWERLHALLLARLRAAGALEWSRAVADSSHVQAKKGAPRRARARLIAAGEAPSTTSSSTRPGCRSPGRSPAATATTSPS
jgi:transposase